jgi:predicted transcriptional regulator
MKSIHVEVDDAVHFQLKSMAVAEMTTISELVREAIIKYHEIKPEPKIQTLPGQTTIPDGSR